MTSKNVYLFVPNIIGKHRTVLSNFHLQTTNFCLGYLRVILAFVAFWAAKTYPFLFGAAYTVSELLDQWDGHAARAYDQCKGAIKNHK